MSKAYEATGPYEFVGHDIPEQALEAARKQAKVLWSGGAIVLRSCWVCNSAHVHLIEDKDHVLNCFSCGHFYLGGVDVTEEAA